MYFRPLVAAVFAALAAPSLASAQDFCVNAPAGCVGTPVSAAGLSAALTGAQANGTADRFLLAPGTYAATAFAYQSAEPLQLIGAGTGATVLTGTAGPVLTLGGNPASEVSGLTLRPATGASSGLKLIGARAGDVAVDATASPSVGAGVLLVGDTVLDHATVGLNTVGGPAVLVYSGNATVSDATLTAPGGYGVADAGGDATVQRSTLVAPQGALTTAGHLAVSDTLIDLRGHNPGTVSIGVDADTSASGSVAASADAERVTIAGATADTIGVAAKASDLGRSSAVVLRDSVITGAGVPISREAGPGSTATVTTDHSAYAAVDPGHDVGPGSLAEHDRIAADPRFADAPYGDFHLAAGSPLIDAGTPGPLPAGTTDRDGNPRPADGDGDCVAVTDVGAFEFAGAPCRPAPVASPAPAPPSAPAKPVISHVKVARGAVSFRLSEPATVRLRFRRRGHRAIARRQVAARAGANRVRIALRPGRYRLTLVALDRAGARSRPATVRFTLTRPRLGAP
jgi:hypothetical protein